MPTSKMSKNRKDDIIRTKIPHPVILVVTIIGSMLAACFCASYHSAFAQSSGGQDPTVAAANPSSPFTLNSTTVFKTYDVYLRITPNANGDVNSTGFQVRFTDRVGNPVSNPVTYNFS